jgi:hypothetical protein
MKKFIKKEMHESKSGEIYEIQHFEETFEHEGEDIVQDSIRILRTQYKANQKVEVTDATKSLIKKIAKGNSQ